MKVIHDNELDGIAMIPLICDWRIQQTCQVDGCEEKTNTILCLPDYESPIGKAIQIGICEKHYLSSRVTDDEFSFKVSITLYEKRSRG